MATATVYIPTPWRRLTGGMSHVPIDLDSGPMRLSDLVGRLDERYPGLGDELWQGDDFKHYVNVYLNGEEVRAIKGARTPVSDGDQVAFVPMLAGGADQLVISSSVRDEMIQQALREYPNECCGMLAGRDSEASLAYPMTNAEASPVVYRMDPKEQLRFYDLLSREGLDEVAAYHSHTHSPAYPSQTDVRLAHSYLTYVIVSLQEREEPRIRAFRIDDGQITEVEVVVR